MSSKHSKNKQEVEEGSVQPDERNDDDESTDDEVNDDDASTSSEDSSAESSPPESISGDKIRQNARELLLSSPDRPSRPAAGSNINPTTNKASGYQSYHEAPPARMSSSSQFTHNSDGNTNPPWANGDGNQNEGGLSMTDVASLAFTCVSHCLTEGYRAASTYYNAHEEGQYPSVPGPQNYQQVDGYYNDNISGNDSMKSNGYSGSYQSKFSDNASGTGEVMDRGLSQHTSQSSGQDTEQGVQKQMENQKEEWATVQVPSTYQGGRVSDPN